MRRTVVVHGKLGLHLRPAGRLCTLACEYQSKITMCVRGREFNVKSLLNVLSACVKAGDELELHFEGPDEATACEKICAFIENID